MGNNKKSSRSSRGRSNYVKTMQRSYAKPKRVRKDESAQTTSGRVEDNISVMLKGLITGGIAGLIVGSVLGNAMLYCLGGCAVGGAIGCVIDLMRAKGYLKKKN